MKRISMFLTLVIMIAMIATPSLAMIEDMSVTDKYTDEKLAELYKQYDISENDVKFANNELPNFLEGTILFSDYKVFVSEDGKALEGMERGKDYDVVISEAEMIGIIEKAEYNYQNKYGVDPSNPKLDVVDGKAIPTSEVKKLVDSGELKVSEPVTISERTLTTLASVSWNPKEVNNQVYIHVFPSTGSQAPTESYYQDTIDGTERFEQFGTTINRVWHYNFWNAGSSTDASYSLNYELIPDCSWVRDADNDLVLGWVNNLNHNGIAKVDGPYSVNAVKASGLDWEHDCIVQHEVSHNFGPRDADVTVTPCIMHYPSAYLEITDWCTSCGNEVKYGIEN